MNALNQENALIQALTETPEEPKTDNNELNTNELPTSNDFTSILPSISDNFNIFNSHSDVVPGDDILPFDKEIKLETPELDQPLITAQPISIPKQQQQLEKKEEKVKKQIQVTTAEERKILNTECTIIFESFKYPTMQQVQDLSERINVSVKKIRSWFQTQRNKARRLNGLIGSGKRLGADEEDPMKPTQTKDEKKPITPERQPIEKKQDTDMQQHMQPHNFYNQFHQNYMGHPRMDNGFFNPHYPMSQLNTSSSHDGFDSPFDQSFPDSSGHSDYSLKQPTIQLKMPELPSFSIQSPQNPVQNGFITPPSFKNNNNHLPTRSRFLSDTHFDFESSLADVFKSDKDDNGFAALKLTTHIESIDINALDKYYDRIRRHSSS